MRSARAALCVAAALAALAQPVLAAGPVVRCGPCDAGALELCAPLPEGCAERVREPGCGCCVTCALLEGEPCGVYTRRCGAGLKCGMRPGETKPLRALLEGRGVCTGTGTGAGALGTPSPGERGNTETTTDVVEEASASSTGTGELRVTPGAQEPWMAPPHAKAEVIRKEQIRQTQSFKVEQLPGSARTEGHGQGVPSMTQPEYGPCRREMDSIMNNLKGSNTLNPKSFRIPNCDKRGFYKKKQCRPSKGRRRGICWCVDKYGQPIPGFVRWEKGVTQCPGLDNK
ncbi:insulin-like growth factor-binding protein 3 isoform X1 [Scleropages formosus]|nr:insulin-like growth factor-binding protein 3 isoform X1 [Scleropages formosus]